MPNNYPKNEEFISLNHTRNEIVDSLLSRRLKISTQADLIDSLDKIEKTLAFVEDRPKNEILVRPSYLDLPQDEVRAYLHENPGYKASESSSGLILITGEIKS